MIVSPVIGPVLAPRPVDDRLARRAVGCFGVGDVLAVEELAQGLMNRNWRVGTTGGAFALKQVLDIDQAQAVRQHRVTRAMAAEGLPVPCPLTNPTGSTLVDVYGELFTLLGWVDGDHRKGADLGLEKCADLGQLLARLHVWLSDHQQDMELEPAPDSCQIAATGQAAASATIRQYLDVVAARPDQDDFDQAEMHQWSPGPSAARHCQLHRRAQMSEPDPRSARLLAHNLRPGLPRPPRTGSKTISAPKSDTKHDLLPPRSGSPPVSNAVRFRFRYAFA